MINRATKRLLGVLLSAALAMASVAVSAAALNFGAKIVFESQSFQITHRTGIRGVEYMLKQRPYI